MSAAGASRGEFTRLMARDGHEFDAWLSPPAGKARGAVLVLQEIFGVNSHIRAVADGFAAEGYLAIAPSLFDRVRRNVEMGYTPPDVEHGRGYVAQLSEDKLLLDMRACINVVRHAGPVAAVGYCWGGMLAAATAQRLAGSVDAAVGYYGGGIAASLLDAAPALPLQLHFAEDDHAIPMADVDKVRSAWPSVPVFVYPGAQHGFNCDQRATYQAQAARVALSRTLRFFTDQVG